MDDSKVREIINAFRGLYSGELAQMKRDAGDAMAMPPWAEVKWFGKHVAKNPMDLWLYQEVLVETRPDVIVECGTNAGGAAFYFAVICDLLNRGRVLTIDKDSYAGLWTQHPRITYLVGDTIDTETVSRVRTLLANCRAMVSLDSDHSHEHVKRELELYSSMVAVGCYIAVEDVYVYGAGEEWQASPVKGFLDAHPEFERDLSRERHLLTSNHWLRRIR